MIGFWLSISGLIFDIIGVIFAAPLVARASDNGRRNNALKALSAVERDAESQASTAAGKSGLKTSWRRKIVLPTLELYVKEIAPIARHLGLGNELQVLQRYLADEFFNVSEVKLITSKLRSEITERWEEVPSFINVRKAERWGFFFILFGFVLQLFGQIFSIPLPN